MREKIVHIIEVLGLPPLSEEQAEKLEADIVAVAVHVIGYNLKNTGLAISLRQEIKRWHLGESIVVKVTEAPVLQEYVLETLAPALGNIVSNSFPKAHVVCLARKYDHNQNVFWSSKL